MARHSCGLSDWLLHIGGLAAFIATFASIYVLIAGLSFGFDILQALIVELVLFCGGIGIWAVVQTSRMIAELQDLAAYRRAGAALVLTHAGGRRGANAMARTPERPGHEFAGEDMPGAGFGALPV